MNFIKAQSCNSGSADSMLVDHHPTRRTGINKGNYPEVGQDGGRTRSSAEVSVMEAERRGSVMQLKIFNNSKKMRRIKEEKIITHYRRDGKASV